MDVEPVIPPYSVPSSPAFVPPPTTSGRARQFPARYQDFLPNSRTRVPHMPIQTRQASPVVNQTASPAPTTPEPQEPLLQEIQTDPNEFGLYRVYATRPIIDPDENTSLEDVCDSPGLATAPNPTRGRWWTRFGRLCTSTVNIAQNLFAPFKNTTVFRLINWYHSGSGKLSVAQLNSLVNDVFSPLDFDKSHLNGFRAERELQRLDDEEDSSFPFSNENVWKISTVRIPLPAEGVKHTSEETAPSLEVPGVHHRSLVEAITTAFQDDSAQKFHYIPYHLFWKATPESDPERVITELYNSDAFIGEYADLLKCSSSARLVLEIGIAALMVWSDSTHLADFGNASLWPIYLFFGNQSKYSRAKPTDFAAHHIAYMPKVDTIFCRYFRQILIISLAAP